VQEGIGAEGRVTHTLTAANQLTSSTRRAHANRHVIGFARATQAQAICTTRCNSTFAVLFLASTLRIAEIQGFGLYMLLWRRSGSVMCSRRISAAPRFSRFFKGMRDVLQEQSRITASPAHRKVGAVLVLLCTHVRVLVLRP
jgi:hypothetical protein